MIPRRTLLTLAGTAASRALDASFAARAAELAAPPAHPMLTAGFAPILDEVDLPALIIRGEIPAALRGGAYLRNGPNPQFAPESYTFPFDGDGMIHALSFSPDGRAAYRNRFVLTRGLAAERRAGRALYGGLAAPRRPDPALLRPGEDRGPFKNLANTSVIRHAGRLLALWEGGAPYELGPDLATIGPMDFEGRLPRVTAHPRVDPATGELVMFAYEAGRPELDLMVADAAGRITERRSIPIGHSLMIHDFAITPRHLVFLCCPLVFDVEAGSRPGGRFLQWRPGLGTRIALVERHGPGIRWFDTEPFFTYHLVNAHEAAAEVVVDFVRYAGFGTPRARLERARLGAAGARLETLDERGCELPRVDPRRVGQPHAHAWLVAKGSDRLPRGVSDSLAHWDAAGGALRLQSFGPGQEVDEPVFVADPARGAEGGWLMAYVYDRAADTSRLVILDALDLSRSVAEVFIGRRVPHGLHGNWMPDFRIG